MSFVARLESGRMDLAVSPADPLVRLSRESRGGHVIVKSWLIDSCDVAKKSRSALYPPSSSLPDS